MNMNVLEKYLFSNVAPILIDFIDSDNIPYTTIIPANCKTSELNGYYDNIDFLAPKWYYKLVSNNDIKLLVIDKIDSISKEEQLKFVELLKYRQVSTFKLPKDTIIILTATKISKDTINEEIYSLVAHIVG